MTLKTAAGLHRPAIALCAQTAYLCDPSRGPVPARELGLEDRPGRSGVNLYVHVVRLCTNGRGRLRLPVAAGQLHAVHPDYRRDVFSSVPTAAAADEGTEAG